MWTQIKIKVPPALNSHFVSNMRAIWSKTLSLPLPLALSLSLPLSPAFISTLIGFPLLPRIWWIMRTFAGSEPAKSKGTNGESAASRKGLQSCLELRFLAKLPKAISPKEGLEQQRRQQQWRRQQQHERAPLTRWFEFYLCVLWILFILLCKYILHQTRLTLKSNSSPWRVRLGLGKGSKGMEKYQAQL